MAKKDNNYDQAENPVSLMQETGHSSSFYHKGPWEYWQIGDRGTGNSSSMGKKKIILAE